MKTKTADSLNVERLYHYQTFDESKLARMFSEGTIFCSNPNHFNDPWDCRPCFSKSVLDDPKEYERTVLWLEHCGKAQNTSLSEAEYLQQAKSLRSNRKLLDIMIDQLTSEMAHAIQTRYRIYCLSIYADSILMWSHYADKCKGLCLEFSARDELFGGALKVEYTDEYPAFDVSAKDDEANLKMLITKSSIWNYEDEFRVIAAEKSFMFQGVTVTNQNILKLPKGALQAIITGPLMTESDRKSLRSLVYQSGWNITLKQASLIPDRYALEIHNLD